MHATLARTRAFRLTLPVAIACAALAVTACAKPNDSGKATTATAAPSPPQWMRLSDGSLHAGLDEAPKGLYVGGDLKDGHFTPGGDIEGDGATDVSGTPAWLELTTGHIVEAQPQPPYVAGTRGPAGFAPKSRKVTY